jgi:hypothetical protein
VRNLGQQLGASGRQRYIAKLVGDQQLHRGKVALHRQQATFVARHRFIDPPYRCRSAPSGSWLTSAAAVVNVTVKPFWQDGQAEGERNIRLACAAVA